MGFCLQVATEAVVEISPAVAMGRFLAMACRSPAGLGAAGARTSTGQESRCGTMEA